MGVVPHKEVSTLLNYMNLSTVTFMSALSDKHLHDEQAAYAYVEARIWPNGAVCPRCKGANNKALKGKSTRIGVYKCYDCYKPFTVKIGTIFEQSHVPLHQWLQAMYLMASSKKGISSLQLSRTLGVTLKTAWFMSHRIREAMAPHSALLGGMGKVVEVDETFLGGKEKNKHAKDRLRQGRGTVGKKAVLSLVERNGKVRSTHVPSVNANTLRPVLDAQLDKASRLMTDDARQYIPLGKDYSSHEVVIHSIGEYVRGTAHTNTAESYFSIFKRGMNGVYQHCSEKHLKRYLAEFDFRHNNRAALGIEDNARAEELLLGVKGKRLKFKD